MAWVDDRIWCHPKFTDISAAAFRTYVCGVAYSSGFQTRGVLTGGQQTTIGSTARVRRELVTAGLWDERDNLEVEIHGWEEHNGKRDERRAKDRVRKAESRLSAGKSARPSAGQSRGRSGGGSTVSAHVDGSEGSEGSDKDKEPKPSAAGAALVVIESRPPKLLKHQGQDQAFDVLAAETGVSPGSNRVKEVAVALNGNRGSEGIRSLYWHEFGGYGEAFEAMLCSEIRQRAMLYRRKMPGARLTPPALAKWWVDLPGMRDPTGAQSADEMLAELTRKESA